MTRIRILHLEDMAFDAEIVQRELDRASFQFDYKLAYEAGRTKERQQQYLEKIIENENLLRYTEKLPVLREI